MHISFEEGVSSLDGEYSFDYLADSDNDIFHIATQRLKFSQFSGCDYYFGYEFTPSSTSKQRGDFIKYLKGYSDKSITSSQLLKLVQKPLVELNKVVNLMSIDALIYPSSAKNTVCRDMVKAIDYMLPHNVKAFPIH